VVTVDYKEITLSQNIHFILVYCIDTYFDNYYDVHLNCAQHKLLYKTLLIFPFILIVQVLFIGKEYGAYLADDKLILYIIVDESRGNCTAILKIFYS